MATPKSVRPRWDVVSGRVDHLIEPAQIARLAESLLALRQAAENRVTALSSKSGLVYSDVSIHPPI